jgi:hypothetical protein
VTCTRRILVSNSSLSDSFPRILIRLVSDQSFLLNKSGQKATYSLRSKFQSPIPARLLPSLSTLESPTPRSDRFRQRTSRTTRLGKWHGENLLSKVQLADGWINRSDKISMVTQQVRCLRYIRHHLLHCQGRSTSSSASYQRRQLMSMHASILLRW